jgi:heterodisulfide reductase subunit A
MCPFNAISFLEDSTRGGGGVTEINPALCQGCGTCVSACPAGAIRGTHFTDEQIMAQIEGVLLRNAGNGHALSERAEAGPAKEAAYA